MNNIRIALGQIHSCDHPEDNLALVAEYTQQAAQAGAECIVFPEASFANFAAPLAALAQPLEGPWAQGIANLSLKHGISIIVGSFTPAGINEASQPQAPQQQPHPQKLYNTTLIARGKLPLSYYHKTHLYDAFHYRESDVITAGSQYVSVAIGKTRIGVTTCYDIRFPHIYTSLASSGAAVITVGASWGSGPDKLRQWTLLAQARALDSGSYVIACDQASPPGANPSPTPLGIGHSLVCAPDGSIVRELGEGPELGIVDLDLSRVQLARDTIGMLRNKVEGTIVSYD